MVLAGREGGAVYLFIGGSTTDGSTTDGSTTSNTVVALTHCTMANNTAGLC